MSDISAGCTAHHSVEAAQGWNGSYRLLYCALYETGAGFHFPRRFSFNMNRIFFKGVMLGRT